MRFRQLALRSLKNKEWLTDLDSAIGDADHGINMSRGFTAVGAKLEALGSDKDPAAVLKNRRHDVDFHGRRGCRAFVRHRVFTGFSSGCR